MIVEDEDKTGAAGQASPLPNKEAVLSSFSTYSQVAKATALATASAGGSPRKPTTKGVLSVRSLGKTARLLAVGARAKRISSSDSSSSDSDEEHLDDDKFWEKKDREAREAAIGMGNLGALAVYAAAQEAKSESEDSADDDDDDKQEGNAKGHGDPSLRTRGDAATAASLSIAGIGEGSAPKPPAQGVPSSSTVLPPPGVAKVLDDN